MKKNSQLRDFYTGKKAFITGHLGFKGAWLCKILTMLGADVTGFSLIPDSQFNLFSALGLDGNMKSIIGDIRDLSLLSKSLYDFQPDFVFHLAAQPIVRESYKNPVETYSTNVMGTVNLFDSIRQCSTVRSVVNITTDKVYWNREQSEGYIEDDILDGFDPYSNSKSCSELVTACYVRSFFAEREISISTARAGNVIGGGDFAPDRIIPDCVRAIEKNEKIVIRNPNSIRPYQHVFDALFAYLMIAQKQYDSPNLSGAYNVGPDQNGCYTTLQLVESFCSHWGDEAQWECQTQSGPHEANFLRLDCQKIKNTLGWKPVWNTETALQKTAQWYQQLDAESNLSTYSELQINQFLADRDKL